MHTNVTVQQVRVPYIQLTTLSKTSNALAKMHTIRTIHAVKSVQVSLMIPPSGPLIHAKKLYAYSVRL
jgi:hypothetical protein